MGGIDMLYMVRIRDVLDGRERWLDDSQGRHWSAPDRQTADCAALALARYGTMELAYVVEVDPSVEYI